MCPKVAPKRISVFLLIVEATPYLVPSLTGTTPCKDNRRAPSAGIRCAVAKLAPACCTLGAPVERVAPFGRVFWEGGSVLFAGNPQKWISVFLFLGVASISILSWHPSLSKKTIQNLGKQLVLENNDGRKEWGINP